MASLRAQTGVGGSVAGIYDGSSVRPLASSRRRSLRETGQRLFLSMLLFGMFGEWLYPLHSFLGGEPYRLIALFLGVTGILLAAGCLRLPTYLYAPIPVVLVAGALLYLYGQETGMSWFVDYAGLIVADVTEIVQSGRLYGISEESRALLLLIGWTLLVVSVQMLALGKHSIMLFFLATLLYLIAIEFAGNVPVYSGLIRSAGWGLILQALLFRNQLHIGGKPGGISFGSVVAAFCVLGALLLSSLLPIQPVRNIPWNQIVQALEGWSGSELSGRPQTSYAVSGYSKDDSRLGAPLRLRHETYFTAVSPQNTYWRGESKSVYTGRGWASSPTASHLVAWSNTTEDANAADGVTIEGEGIAGIAGTAAEEATEDTAESLAASPASGSAVIKQSVMFMQPVTGKVPFFSGGSTVSIDQVFAENLKAESAAVSSRYDDGTGANYFEPAYPEQELYGYELTAQVPAVSASRLRLAQGDDPMEITARELQLPDQLPERVERLGTALTEGHASRYDAVVAVMNYLEKHYIYNLDTEAPPDGNDFVDYFLFGQKQGYCDHYSTAMTVLLRSGGIPARWVKGFAPGTPVSEDDNRINVSYADAHAWVEVYFPGEGWIPFDPTPGYESVFAAGQEEPAGVKDSLEKDGWWQKLLLTTGVLSDGLTKFITKGWNMLQESLLLWSSVALGIVFVLYTAIIYRRTWLREGSYLMWLFMLKRRRRFPERSELLRAADRVWKEIYLTYGPKTSGMTAREYLSSIHAKVGEQSVNLESFVMIWENLYYGAAGMDRTKSRDFLKLCRNLAYRGR
ncbi:transglutaminase domain-containing protein [Paenibacillus sp. FSL R5-0407]|uniref:transglutaminase-like domain-containing protein n=1 Tax=Paenibacillus sp. FSL R5-0407 TaxID=2975320 RepID=UPI0030F67E47